MEHKHIPLVIVLYRYRKNKGKLYGEKIFSKFPQTLSSSFNNIQKL